MSWAAALWISCALCPACSMTRCASVGRPIICGNTRCSTAFATLVAFLKPKFCAAWPTPPAPAARMLVSPAAAASPTPAETAAGLAWIWRPRRIEAISPVSFVLRVCVGSRLQKTVEGKVCLDSHRRRSRSRWPLPAKCAALDFRPTAPWIAGIRPGRSGWICRCWHCGWAEGCRNKPRLLRCIPLLHGSEHLPPLRAGPPELGDSAVDRLRHPAHGVGVLLALPFQLPVLEPLVERSGIKHLGSSCFTFGDGSTCVERHKGPGFFIASWPSFSAAGFLDWTRHFSWADSAWEASSTFLPWLFGGATA